MAISVGDSKTPELFGGGNEMQRIGNPVRLNPICDPYHRISSKMEQFLTMIDLIPVDWTMDLKRFLKSDEEKKDQKGVISYKFGEAITRYKGRCIKYGLSPPSGLRVLTNSDSSYSDMFENKFGDNEISNIANKAADFLGGARDTLRSFGAEPNDIIDKLKNSNTKSAASLKAAGANYGGDIIQLAEDVLLKGRRMSLPKIYSGSGYSPSFNGSVKLVSPYGNPKAIQRFIVEPLLYMLLLSCPDTDDGLTYGGYTFLKIRGYGITDINLGYISQLSVDRGGQDVPTNKHGQPLTINIRFTINTAIDGFACINDKATNLMGLNVNEVQGESSGSFQDIEGDYGLTTVDNIIRSFKPSPGSDRYTNNGEYNTGILGVLATKAQGGLSSFGSEVNSIKGGLTGSLSGALSSVLMT